VLLVSRLNSNAKLSALNFITCLHSYTFICVEWKVQRRASEYVELRVFVSCHCAVNELWNFGVDKAEIINMIDTSRIVVNPLTHSSQ
jgi:hypothetical protein